MSDIVERLRFIAIDNADSLTEDEHNTLSEVVTLLSEAEQREKDARAKALEEAKAICNKQAAEFRKLSASEKCLSDIRWNDRGEARHTMQSYAERHEADAAAIRALQSEGALMENLEQKLADFLDALDAWDCDDNLERAKHILEFQRQGYDLSGYEDGTGPARDKREVN